MEREWLLVYWTRNAYHEMRHAEVDGLLAMCSSEPVTRWKDDRQAVNSEYPFDYCFMSLPEATFVAENSVLVKAVVRVWFDCGSVEEVQREARANPPASLRPLIAPPNKTFSFIIDAYNKKISAEESEARRTEMTFLFTGKEIANLKSPDEVLWMWEVCE